MNTHDESIQHGIWLSQDALLRRLLYFLNEVDPLLVEMIARGCDVDQLLECTGLPLDGLQERIKKLIKRAEELRHGENQKLDDGGPNYECKNLVVIDIIDFLLDVEDLEEEICLRNRHDAGE